MKYELRHHPQKGQILWLTDGKTEVGLALDYGIRILHLSCAGCENLLYEQPSDLSDGLSTAQGWRIYGGHRYWTAPESDLSYYPDNAPVTYELTERGVILCQENDPLLQVKKQLQLEFAEDGSILLHHRAENTSGEVRTFASWGVTTFDKGNACVELPRGKAGSYNPDRRLSLWGESSLADNRIRFEEDQILASHDPTGKAFKMGVFSSTGRAVLTNKQQKFILSFEADSRGTYPDGGCNFELFLDANVLELEALGQIASVNPGEAAAHWERWQVERI